MWNVPAALRQLVAAEGLEGLWKGNLVVRPSSASRGANDRHSDRFFNLFIRRHVRASCRTPASSSWRTIE